MKLQIITSTVPPIQDTLVYLDLLFVSYFLVEMILKVTTLDTICILFWIPSVYYFGYRLDTVLDTNLDTAI